MFRTFNNKSDLWEFVYTILTPYPINSTGEEFDELVRELKRNNNKAMFQGIEVTYKGEY